nr:FAD-dependent oxidoreductase [Chelatococcus sp.]
MESSAVSRATTYPIAESRCGWNALLPPRPPKTVVKIGTSYEYAVIGGGYTGLAAARRLAELAPAASILLIEASEIGEGTSARNSGFILTAPLMPHRSGHAADVAKTIKQGRIFDAGLTWLKRLVTENSMSCDWNETGKYHAAVTESGIAGLRSLADQYRDCGLLCEEIQPSDFSARIGLSYYKYALRTGNNIYVQPASLVRGLADSLPPNVTLVERAPVLSVSGRRPFLLELRGGDSPGSNRCDREQRLRQEAGLYQEQDLQHLHLRRDDPRTRRRGTCRPWNGRRILPAARAGTTLRRTIGRRFLVRSLHSYESEKSRSEVEASLQDLYKHRYPHLRTHRFEYVWGGALGLTGNTETCFGKIADNIYTSAGCNGVGIMKGTAYGKLLAEMILGQNSEDIRDVRQMNSPSWLPPDPVLRWGVEFVMRRRKHQAGAER